MRIKEMRKINKWCYFNLRMNKKLKFFFIDVCYSACTVANQLKNLSMPPLLHGCFWYFCGAKIVL